MRRWEVSRSSEILHRSSLDVAVKVANIVHKKEWKLAIKRKRHWVVITKMPEMVAIQTIIKIMMISLW